MDILEYKADVNAKDVDGRSALYAADWRGDEEMAQLLLENKADVTWRLGVEFRR